VTSCEVAIVNPLGLHARAAARYVHTASGFSARIRVARGEREMDGKSIMGLLLLAAAQGCLITISASGSDEEQALAALCALVSRGFDEVAPAPDRSRRLSGIGVGKALVLKRGTRDLRFACRPGSSSAS
jgi:phosphocarrier protein